MPGSGLGPLPDGGTVAVIGGGPAGTGAALALKHEAKLLGRSIRVVILEGKQFSKQLQYNRCAGVLSPPIADIVENDLDVPFPHHLKILSVDGYIVHTGKRQITLDDEADASVSLQRVQFDAYMLQMACERGVEVLQSRLTGLEFHADRVVVYTESDTIQADVVVGAFGLDEGAAQIFADTAGYVPPPTLRSIVTKYHPGEAAMAAFGRYVHAFLPASLDIDFGAITPKGDHLTINIGGVDVNANHMNTFLNLPEVQRVLPQFENSGCLSNKDLCYFSARIPRGLAGNYAGDRYVLVGDASGLVRAFKGKGATTGMQTGHRAARTIMREGISARAFRAYFSANRDVIDDMPYGHAMRYLTIFGSRLGLMNPVMSASEHNDNLRTALHGAVSGHMPYRNVLGKVFKPSSILKLTGAILRGGAQPST